MTRRNRAQVPNKKILLVNTNSEKSPYPVPPLGLCLLADTLKKRYDVEIFDGCFRPTQELVALVVDTKPDFVGFGIRNIDNIVAGNSVYYIDEIKERFVNPVRRVIGVPCIAGGSGFSVFPGEILEQLEIDYGIVGEGEDAFLALLSALENGRDASLIPGVALRGCGPARQALCLRTVDMTVARHADIDKWIDYAPYVQRGAYPIQTKRGCAHRCVYCTYPLIEGQSYRVRDPEEIAHEIDMTQKRLGPIMFEFVDSTFNDPSGHAEAICKNIIKRNIKVRLRTMGINPAKASKVLFSLMVAAGFSQIDCTPDTGSPSMLLNLRKNFVLKDLENTAGLIRKFDIPTMWFFIFGGPGETETTLAETFAFIDRWVHPDDMVYMMAGIRIYPGTELHRIACEQGVIDKRVSLLRPVFYVSPTMTKSRIDELILQASQTRPNCITAAESTPPPEMMGKALDLRKAQGLTEPMFRTLMRIRREMLKQGNQRELNGGGTQI